MNPDLIFKSNPLNWWKEHDGEKPNTVRVVEITDPRYDILSEGNPKRIRIVNAANGAFFEREITDVTYWPVRDVWIISWKHDENQAIL